MKRSGTSRRPHVVTSQRRDVGSTNVQVNKQQRRDVSTSRRLNVAMLQRRDVNASSAFSSLKANGGADLGDREAYERGHGIPAQQRHRLRRSARDLYCFSFLLDIRMMFFRLNNVIFLFSMF